MAARPRAEGAIERANDGRGVGGRIARLEDVSGVKAPEERRDDPGEASVRRDHQERRPVVGRDGTGCSSGSHSGRSTIHLAERR